jgi:hypothetical protein
VADTTNLPAQDKVKELLHDTLGDMVAGKAAPVESPASEVKPLLDQLLKRPSTMRDGLFTLLAYPVVLGAPMDFKALPKFPGARAVAQYLAEDVLPDLKIAGMKDSLQTGVKGVSTYYDRANPTWKGVLGWVSQQTDVKEIEKAWRYLASGMAATARDLPPLPEIDTPRLTFASVFAVFDSMLSTPSGGAVQQFAFAAVLEAYGQQLNEPGVIETKNINASDASAGTVADVQHKHRGQVSEAYEVTANDWESKVKQARSALEARDLKRIHILAAGVAGVDGAILEKALPNDIDVSVLDVREEIRSFVGRLDKFHRRLAIERLYAHLVEKQSNDQLVKDLVAKLAELNLT